MKRVINRITRLYNNNFIYLLLLSWFARYWVPWMQWVSVGLLILYLISIIIRNTLFYKRSKIYLALRGGAKWQRFKGIYKSQLQTERIVAIMFIAVIVAIIIGIVIKG